MIAYIGYWTAGSSEEKRRLVGEAWEHARASLSGLRELGMGSEFWMTLRDLAETAALVVAYDWDFDKKKRIIKEALDFGEAAIGLLSSSEEHGELAGSYAVTAWYAALFRYYVGDENTEHLREKASRNWRKAVELSEGDALTASTRLVVLLTSPEGPVEHGDLPMVLQKALEQARREGDRFAIGCSFDMLANAAGWSAVSAEDPDLQRSLVDKLLSDSIAARNEYAICGFVSPNFTKTAWATAPHIGYHYITCYVASTDLKDRLFHARSCLEELDKSRDLALDAGYPELQGNIEDSYMDMFRALAEMETSPEKKRPLLMAAHEHGKERERIFGLVYPYSNWTKFGMAWGTAYTQFDLAMLAKNSEERRTSLENAVKACREALDNAGRIPAWSLKDPTKCTVISDCWNLLASLLGRLHELTGERVRAIESAAAYEDSAAVLLKSEQYSRAAESHWKAARTYDLLNERKKSSERFRLAADSFRNAVKSVPRLERFYLQHASYMEAWSEIEKAMYHHGRREPAQSKTCFERAASLHESAGDWSYLAANYRAWARLENGEDASQADRSAESIESFREASGLFGDSKKSMKARLGRIESADERESVEGMIRAADRRQEFARARAVLEEARLLDRESKESDACEKYDLAVDMLGKIRKGLASMQEQREIDLIITLTRAWREMSRAEMEASPQAYAEAGRLFDEVKELSPTEREKYLAMGHSWFCKALEAGVRFSETGDLPQHSVATDSLENAAKFYLKAGHENAAEYARASKLLFDAYVHMGKAGKDESHDKKATQYALAEKILQASAASYEKAGQQGKKEQVTRLLSKVQQDKELAVSLTEILRAPEVVSAAMTLSSPSPIQESAVGLERFEHADVQATLLARPRDLNVGENFSLEIELVNAGKGVAQLTKVEGITPKGFDVAEVPERYRLDDSFLNLRGRRLDALKTEDVKIILKARRQGRFTLTPRIMYLDDLGKYRSFEPEPVEVTVKELGISGWLKGPEKR